MELKKYSIKHHVPIFPTKNNAPLFDTAPTNPVNNNAGIKIRGQRYSSRDKPDHELKI
jgi:hypothetical protein